MNYIYTDGGCKPNPGPGAWAIVVVDHEDNIIIQKSGSAHPATNNTMEMTAMKLALQHIIKNPGEYIIYTDSEYVKNGTTVWVNSWMRKGWKTASGKPVLNKELWIEIHELHKQIPKKDLDIVWVRGHSGNVWNQMADDLCTKLLP